MSKAARAREFVRLHEAALLAGTVNKSQLARMLHEAERVLFPTVEMARTAIRTATGANGSKTITGAPAFDFKSTIEHGLKALPTRAEPIPPHVINGPVRILVLSDIHLPYHEPDAIQVALEYGIEHGAEQLYINGDLVDMYHASTFDKDPRACSLAQELAMTREFLALMVKLFPKGVWWKFGNHEERFEKMLIRNAPHLIEVPGIGLAEVVLRDADLPVTIVPSLQITKMGHLNVLHGHEGGKSLFSPVSPARGACIRLRASVIIGHHHQTSVHHSNNLNGDQMAFWSTGCLRDLQPSYRPLAYIDWNHGFAMVDVHEDRTFTVTNLRILNMGNGKLRVA